MHLTGSQIKPFIFFHKLLWGEMCGKSMVLSISGFERGWESVPFKECWSPRTLELNCVRMTLNGQRSTWSCIVLYRAQRSERLALLHISQWHNYSCLFITSPEFCPEETHKYNFNVSFINRINISLIGKLKPSHRQISYTSYVYNLHVQSRIAFVIHCIRNTTLSQVLCND